jgi:hypothetical protein
MQPTARTCGESCRKKRARRLAKKKTRKVPEHLAPMHDAVTKATDDAVQEAVKAELAPIVREAITDDVLQVGRQLMRNIVPARAGGDRRRHQRRGQGPAPARVHAADEVHARQPVGRAEARRPERPADPDQLRGAAARHRRAGDRGRGRGARTCSECGEERPVSDFLEASMRCVHCDAALRARVAERFGS